MIQDEELRDLIELGNAATARPWLYDPEEMQMLPSPSRRFDLEGREGWCGEAAGGNDGRFIVASANLAVPLAEEVLRLRAALVEIRDYWNGRENESAMLDACQHNERTAKEALRDE